MNFSTDQILARFTQGPKHGLFTDGSAQPNPGPGGWGVVYVVDDKAVSEKYGYESYTTNNRMELTALCEAYKMAPKEISTTVWTDSELCYKTITQWAKVWQTRGWKRKGGLIKNLELVKKLYSLVETRPWVKLAWLQAHKGLRWNEYADALATTYLRRER